MAGGAHLARGAWEAERGDHGGLVKEVQRTDARTGRYDLGLESERIG